MLTVEIHLLSCSVVQSSYYLFQAGDPHLFFYLHFKNPFSGKNQLYILATIQ
jgi:hypothetical protein